MFKKCATILTLFLMLFPAVAKACNIILEPDTEQCALRVTSTEKQAPGVFKILIEKDGMRYYYDILQQEEFFPLQMGVGTYKIAILKHIEGYRYRYIHKEQISVFADYNFLASVQNIPWRRCPDVVKTANELTKYCISDLGRLLAIHEYITQEISYWHVPGRGHIPNPEAILREGRGNCYDYSSLFASMLRSIGIPCKLVIGHVDGYKALHAWNEVLVGDEWMIVDATFDAVHGRMGKRVGYWKEKEY